VTPMTNEPVVPVVSGPVASVNGASLVIMFDWEQVVFVTFQRLSGDDICNLLRIILEEPL